ncbi:MAG: acyl carrier protein [Aquabacterium sp.]
MSTTEALAMLAQAFDAPPEEVKVDTPRANLPGWDSMGVVMLSAELDERFGLELPAEVSRAMTKVSDALDFLRAQGVLADH